MRLLNSWIPTRRAVSVLVTASLVMACGDSGTDPEEEGIARFAGSWTSSAFSITSQLHPGTSFDLVGAGGAVQMSVQPSGSFSGTATIPGSLLGIPELGTVNAPISGMIRIVDATTLRIDYIPELPPVFTTMEPSFTLSQTTWTMEDPSAVWDFDADGIGDAGTFLGTFVRN